MSRDAQHRAPQRIALEATELVGARLTAAGYGLPPDFAIAVCPRCESEVSLRLNHDLIGGDYYLECIHCDLATLRSYYDPIEAALRWNAMSAVPSQEDAA